MNLAQLESDLRAAKERASTLIAETGQRCRDHVVTPASATTAAVTGRLMTAEERGAIEAELKAGEELQRKIDSMKGDAAFSARLEQLTGSGAPRPATPQARTSLGTQFINAADYQAFIKAQRHRISGAWSSPGIECADGGLRMYGATLTEDPASGGSLVTPDVRPGIVPLRFVRPVVADLIAPGSTTSNLVQYMKEKSFTNAADAVREGALKPESALTFESASAPVRKLAHWIPVTEEMLEDFAQIRSIIDARLLLGLQLKEEDELLNGTGLDPHLLGLRMLPGLTPAHPKGADSIADAMLKQMTIIATTTFVVPDGWVMNPNDWMTVQLAKNQQGNYMGSGPYAPPQTPQLWGISGVTTPAMPVGEALVGAYSAMSQIFRRGGVRIEATNSHADFFAKNLVAIRGEERLAFAVYREAAFGKVTGL